MVRKVLYTLQHQGVKCHPEKCLRFKGEVQFVRHLVLAEGVRVDPKDLETALQAKAQ